jgi:guanosine-3',5'-bis(diphosphate) 3'-pyrophosphohydrolase
VKSDLALLLRALAFAAHKHRDQRRKDRAASPYINHPIALATVLTRGSCQHRSAGAACSTTRSKTRHHYQELKRHSARGRENVPKYDDRTQGHPQALAGRARAGRMSLKRSWSSWPTRPATFETSAAPPVVDNAATRILDWAKRVIDGYAGPTRLEAAFDAAYARRPRVNVRKSR